MNNLENSISKILNEERFNFVDEMNKQFIISFTEKMNEIEYDFGGTIGDGYCWGHFMVIYSRKKKVIARFFIRNEGMRIWGNKEHHWDNCIVLRLFFSNINKHIKYIETAPEHIKTTFTNDQYNCTHCSDKCHNRKKYTIGGKQCEKCGYVFTFKNPNISEIDDYIGILKEFYAVKSKTIK